MVSLAPIWSHDDRAFVCHRVPTNQYLRLPVLWMISMFVLPQYYWCLLVVSVFHGMAELHHSSHPGRTDGAWSPLITWLTDSLCLRPPPSHDGPRSPAVPPPARARSGPQLHSKYIHSFFSPTFCKIHKGNIDHRGCESQKSPIIWLCDKNRNFAMTLTTLAFVFIWWSHIFIQVFLSDCGCNNNGCWTVISDIGNILQVSPPGGTQYTSQSIVLISL